MNLKEIMSEGVDWIRAPQGAAQYLALVSTVMNLRVP
jgi:hypothetical protein